jgi:hypothetical protein
MPMSHLSYLGNLLFTDKSGRVTVLAASDMSCDLSSSPQFYDHTMASEAPSSLNQAPVGSSPIQKRTYRYSNIAPKITASGLWTPHHNVLLENAKTVEHINSRPNVTAVFYRDPSKPPIQTVYDVVVNSLTIDIKAGEPVTWSAEFIGPRWDEVAPNGSGGLDNADAIYDGSAPMNCDKVLTWDACEVLCQRSGATSIDDIQSFSITIKNNANNIYTAASIYSPYHVRPGMQEVTGNVATFSFQAFERKYAGETITFKLGDDSWTVRVVYASPSNRGSPTSVFVSTLNFTGAGDGGVWL